MSVPDGAKRVAPGIYDSGDELHIDLEELVREHGGDPNDDDDLARAARQVRTWGLLHGIPVEVELK